MDKDTQNHVDSVKPVAPVQRVKVVAEMPNDAQMREELHERQANDGYPGSCGISSIKEKDNHAKQNRK